MNLVRSVLRQTKTWWLESRYRRPAPVALDRPVVSMTFDDVPLSAYQRGLPILTRQNVKATFYVSMGMSADDGEEYLGPSQILSLHNDGHEIGCHTYSHYRLSTGDTDRLVAEAAKNRTQLAQLLNNGGPQNFSFPYGDLSLAAKKRLQDSYRSLRTSRPGINHGSIDLNCLKAYSLGAVNSTRAYISELLDKAERKNGWLILYTHGVSPDPGQYDIRPETLELLLSECAGRRIEILPIVRVLQVMGNPA